MEKSLSVGPAYISNDSGLDFVRHFVYLRELNSLQLFHNVPNVIGIEEIIEIQHSREKERERERNY